MTVHYRNGRSTRWREGEHGVTPLRTSIRREQRLSLSTSSEPLLRARPVPHPSLTRAAFGLHLAWALWGAEHLQMIAAQTASGCAANDLADGLTPEPQDLAVYK